MNKKIRNLLAATVMFSGLVTFGCANDVKSFQTDLSKQIETVDKQYKKLDYLSTDDQTTLKKELENSKEVEKSGSRSDLEDEISHLKKILTPFESKDRKIAGEITTAGELRYNAAIDTTNKEKLTDLIAKSRDFSDYESFEQACQTALMQTKKQLVEAVSNQANAAIGSTYIPQTDKVDLTAILEKVKKAENITIAYSYLSNLQTTTSQVVLRTKAQIVK